MIVAGNVIVPARVNAPFVKGAVSFDDLFPCNIANNRNNVRHGNNVQARSRLFDGDLLVFVLVPVVNFISTQDEKGVASSTRAPLSFSKAPIVVESLRLESH